MKSHEIWWTWQQAVLRVVYGVISVWGLMLTLITVSYDLYRIIFYWLLNRIFSKVCSVARLAVLVLTIRLQYGQRSNGPAPTVTWPWLPGLATHLEEELSRTNTFLDNVITFAVISLLRRGWINERSQFNHRVELLIVSRFYAGQGDFGEDGFFVRKCLCSQCLLMEHNRYEQECSPSKTNSSESSCHSTPGKSLKGIGLNLAAPYTQSTKTTSPCRVTRPPSLLSLDEQIRILALREMAVVELSDQISELQGSLEKLRSETLHLRNLIKKTVHTQIAADATPHLSSQNQASIHPLWENLSRPLNMLLQFDLLLQAEIEKSMAPTTVREPKSRRPSSDLKPFKNNSVIPLNSAQITTSSPEQWNKELLLQNVSSSIYSFVNDVKTNVMVSLGDEDNSRLDSNARDTDDELLSKTAGLQSSEKISGERNKNTTPNPKTQSTRDPHPKSQPLLVKCDEPRLNGPSVDFSPQKPNEESGDQPLLISPTKDIQLAPSFPALTPKKHQANVPQNDDLDKEYETDSTANFARTRLNPDASSPNIDLDKTTFEGESDESISIDFEMYTKSGGE